MSVQQGKLLEGLEECVDSFACRWDAILFCRANNCSHVCAALKILLQWIKSPDEIHLV